jgi:hypothetical protein
LRSQTQLQCPAELRNSEAFTAIACYEPDQRPVTDDVPELPVRGPDAFSGEVTNIVFDEETGQR